MLMRYFARTLSGLISALCWLVGGQAQAFPYVVESGDTLASIAERMYGRIQQERILVAANGLDLAGGSSIVPGMRLEIPSVTFHRVKAGETWESLARSMLGAPHRAVLLSTANGSSPWLTPEEGSEIMLPYNLRVVVARQDTLITIAYEFMGRRERAWELDYYNSLKGRVLVPGDVVLVPVTDLGLSAEGKQAALKSLGSHCSDATGSVREAQLAVGNELPALIADVKGGRYVDAIVRGNRFLTTADLGKRTLATIHRQLLDAYVALDAIGLAVHSCNEWRKVAAKPRLDPAFTSPKILSACEREALKR
jgi:LysM repeat protein